MKTMHKMLTLMTLAGAMLVMTPAASAQVSFGISFGTPLPPPPPAYAYYHRPVMPGPGFVWIDGFWNLNGGRYAWNNGYWARPPYAGGYWVAPRYNGGRYYAGYWGRGGGNYRNGFRGGDRDHDGVPNRYDRYDNRRGGGFDRDRDGIPNRNDRYDNRRR